ncbi:TRAP transporter large permease subunit [Sulfitobacter sp. M220]|jgi:tripartite ATP-independent transporter DctM subunit|uniref:TRAP transporter large permease protein n=2 Tax=root TaxID=1 RepID=A0A7V1A4J2_9RHOB|nr:MULTISPECIES: TRAP transporter large permease [Sulfitobacter]MCF7726597.1 TRAP transporter large permease subunit [Sulfitobacter sp. M22]MCF7777939.1 TRAP transporter large permease subunit [Sulfitobacter sp. M220]HDY94540.1 TRAP transporter large permease [Sulfitobacter litoralis]HDZ51909.1 TRAP transporter large permease [Sulfitobacter litoralis]|tara:strand:+ start:4129 stop:5439 length:1311 start_codon:yes stop_codon:yes gene_type:complete
MIESTVGILVLLGLIFLRMPIAFAMSLVGGIGFGLMRDWNAAGAMVGNAVFETGLSYSLSVVPLFIFMGNILAQSGIAHGLFAGADRLFGRMKGGLALATILSCGGFSAVSGSSLATAATMSRVAMPPMRKFGYSDSLASGAIAAGGTLGILIPPSVILIIYGLLTESDIGKLFIAGLLPGLLGIILYMVAVVVAVRLKPDLAPPVTQSEPMTKQDRIGVFGTLGLFVFIMGGIYGGFFTPIEAAGMGAIFSLVLALLIRGLNWSGFIDACRQTVSSSGMIFAIIIGAEIFSAFVNFAGLPDGLVDLVYTYDLSAWGVIFIMVAIYLIMGCVFESLSMILLTVPVFYPVVSQLDFGGGVLGDPELVLIWFAVIVVVVTEISLITPPVGMNVFVLRSVLKDVSLSTIFRGVLPFWIADIVRLALLLAVPSISLVLLT